MIHSGSIHTGQSGRTKLPAKWKLREGPSLPQSKNIRWTIDARIVSLNVALVPLSGRATDGNLTLFDLAIMRV